SGGGQVNPEPGDEVFEPEGEAGTGAQPDGGAGQAQQQRLSQHAAGDLPPVGADGAQQREFAGAGGDQHGEGVEDQEDPDEDGDAGEAEQGVGDHVQDRADLLGAGLGLLGAGGDSVAG